jgi:hypothetical protein
MTDSGRDGLCRDLVWIIALRGDGNPEIAGLSASTACGIGVTANSGIRRWVHIYLCASPDANRNRNEIVQSPCPC